MWWNKNQKKEKANDGKKVDKKDQVHHNQQNKSSKKKNQEYDCNKDNKRNKPTPNEANPKKKGPMNGGYHYGRPHYVAQCLNKESVVGDRSSFKENYHIYATKNK